MPSQYTTNRNEDIFMQLIRKKVAKKVAFLKNRKKVSKDNFIKNQIKILSELYEINDHDIEQLFKEEMQRQTQQSVSRENIAPLIFSNQNLFTLTILLFFLLMLASLIIGLF